MKAVSWKDVPLGGGRTLRVSLERGDGGSPDQIRLALGTGRDDQWQPDEAEGVSIPAKVASPLVLALLEVGDQTDVK